MTGPLDFALTAVRTREITKRSRAVVNLENKCARLRRALDVAQDELIVARRFLRGVIADTVAAGSPPAEQSPSCSDIDPEA